MVKELRKERGLGIFENKVIARLEKGGESFEVVVEPDVVQAIRDGEEADLEKGMAIDTIFRDAKKGTRSSEEKMEEVFGTTDPIAVARILIEEGDIQVTTEQRRKMLEAKRRSIIDTIARNAINPQSGTPHPPQRIENAMAEAKVNVDPFKSVDEQVQDVLAALQPLLPIRFEKVKIAVKLSAEDCAKCYGDMKAFGRILQEEWQKSGFWIGVIEMPAGMQTDFFDKLNEKTKGMVETKIVK
ncbi:MAG: ribosome assembly factor SBDS [Methanomassiliicoccales archaeon]|nr:MAG: ribosome assembly factor SBDS [Methanomassiliicoccales archaeon]